MDLANLGARGFRIDGAAAGDALGLAVAGAGDVNGDGRADVLVGAFLAGNNGRLNSGSAYVVFGSASTDTVDLANLGTRGFRIDGAATSDVAGRAVAGAGDVNGDGRADLLVGPPPASTPPAARTPGRPTWSSARRAPRRSIWPPLAPAASRSTAPPPATRPAHPGRRRRRYGRRTAGRGGRRRGGGGQRSAGVGSAWVVSARGDEPGGILRTPATGPFASTFRRGRGRRLRRPRVGGGGRRERRRHAPTCSSAPG